MDTTPCHIDKRKMNEDPTSVLFFTPPHMITKKIALDSGLNRGQCDDLKNQNLSVMPRLLREGVTYDDDLNS